MKRRVANCIKYLQIKILNIKLTYYKSKAFIKNVLNLNHLKLQQEAFVIYKISKNTVKLDNLKEL